MADGVQESISGAEIRGCGVVGEKTLFYLRRVIWMIKGEFVERGVN